MNGDDHDGDDEDNKRSEENMAAQNAKSTFSGEESERGNLSSEESPDDAITADATADTPGTDTPQSHEAAAISSLLEEGISLDGQEELSAENLEQQLKVKKKIGLSHSLNAFLGSPADQDMEQDNASPLNQARKIHTNRHLDFLRDQVKTKDDIRKSAPTPTSPARPGAFNSTGTSSNETSIPRIRTRRGLSTSLEDILKKRMAFSDVSGSEQVSSSAAQAKKTDQRKPQSDSQPSPIAPIPFRARRARQTVATSGLSINSLEDILRKRMAISGDPAPGSADISNTDPPATKSSLHKKLSEEDSQRQKQYGTTNPIIPPASKKAAERYALMSASSEESAKITEEAKESEEFDIINVVRQRAALQASNRTADPIQEIPPASSVPLQRRTNSTEEAPPGAYARAPGMPSVRLDAVTALEEQEFVLQQDAVRRTQRSPAASLSSESSVSSEESSKAPLIEAFLVPRNAAGQQQSQQSNITQDRAERGEQPTQDVPPEDTIELIEAKTVTLLDLLQNRNIQLFIVILLSMVVSISIGLSAWIVVSRDDNTIQEPPQTPEKPIPLMEVLPEYSRIQIEQDAESPQFKSYQWLQGHPDLKNMNNYTRQQAFAMSTFFLSFNGENWGNEEEKKKETDYFGHWRDYSFDVCQWGGSHKAFRIECPSGNDEIAILQVNKNITNFTGTIPKELALLTRLKGLTIQRNIRLTTDISEFLPTQLEALTALVSLQLGKNRLKGTISTNSTLFSLEKLTSLDLSWNLLSGSLPNEEWSKLSNLKRLDLRQNLFIGKVPSELDNLPLKELYLQDNHNLTGVCKTPCVKDSILKWLPLPSFTLKSVEENPLSPQADAWEWLEDNYNHRSLGNFQEWEREQLFALATFYFAFQGPNWPDRLREEQSGWLDLNIHECYWGYVNEQTGNWCINNTFQQISLRRPDNYNNAFPLNGTIPPEVTLLPNLEDLIIVDLGLSAPLEELIPTQLANMPKLQELNLAKNRIQGTIPPFLGNLTSMKYLDLTQNGLHGLIPSELGQLSSLLELNMAGNELGTEFRNRTHRKAAMPIEVCNLPSLKRLVVDCEFVACPAWCNCTCTP